MACSSGSPTAQEAPLRTLLFSAFGYFFSFPWQVRPWWPWVAGVNWAGKVGIAGKDTATFSAAVIREAQAFAGLSWCSRSQNWMHACSPAAARETQISSRGSGLGSQSLYTEEEATGQIPGLHWKRGLLDFPFRSSDFAYLSAVRDTLRGPSGPSMPWPSALRPEHLWGHGEGKPRDSWGIRAGGPAPPRPDLGPVACLCSSFGQAAELSSGLGTALCLAPRAKAWWWQTCPHLWLWHTHHHVWSPPLSIAPL